LQGTKLPMRVWFRAMHLLAQGKKVLSNIELGRRLGISTNAAWQIQRKPMQAMIERDRRYMLGAAGPRISKLPFFASATLPFSSERPTRSDRDRRFESRLLHRRVRSELLPAKVSARCCACNVVGQRFGSVSNPVLKPKKRILDASVLYPVFGVNRGA
jgi:hypothetical protein